VVKKIIIQPDKSGEYTLESVIKSHPESKIPKMVHKVIKHYNRCYMEENRCIHCPDCIAFAIIFSEILELRMPPKGIPYAVPGTSYYWIFTKFLGSSISKEYIPCERALEYEEVKKFAWALLRLPVDLRGDLRKSLICHSEFKSTCYTDHIKVFRMKRERFEEHRKFRLFKWAQEVLQELKKRKES